jgi:hypothetical protein
VTRTRSKAAARTKSKLDAFYKGHVPTIACFNRATVPLGVDYDALIDALQKFVDEHVAPVWGTRAKLIKTNGFVRGCWAMVFLDHADHAHSLAYHDVTPDGFPQAKVFVKTTLKNKKLVSVSASHELVEMLVDPSINLVSVRPHSKLIYGYESADPVEDLDFPVNGIRMTNFVYPAYFETFHKPGTVRFDHLKKLKRPFQVHIGGYQGVYKDGKWTQIFGSHPKKKRFAREDRRGRRGEKRAAEKRVRSSRRHFARPPGKK